MRQLTDKTRRVLAHLGVATDAYLFGVRHGDHLFHLVDPAAIAENRAHSFPLVDRATVKELLDAGYIHDDAGTLESVNVLYRITVDARKPFGLPDA
jgi:hypothetical protein